MGEEQHGPSFNPLIFWPAALLDMVATSLHYIAMHLTYVGSLQGLLSCIMSFAAVTSYYTRERTTKILSWVILTQLYSTGWLDIS